MGLAILGFFASLFGFLGIDIPENLWRPMAVIPSVISLLGLKLFCNTWPDFNVVGAVGMNLAILITQLVLRWPPLDMFGK